MADVEDDAGPVCELQVRGDSARLSPEVELGAFRIVEEAVRNALSHGETHRLRVSVRFGRGELAVAVADDGKGFQPVAVDELAGDGHLGLLGMAERAHLLGGHLEVSSTPGGGTVVDATIPFAP